MKWINLNKTMVTVKGEPAKNRGTEEPVKMNELIANILCGAKSKTPMRMFKLAQKIYDSTGEIEIEDNDFNTMEQLLMQSGDNNLTLGQIEEVLEEAKEESKKRTKAQKK